MDRLLASGALLLLTALAVGGCAVASAPQVATPTPAPPEQDPEELMERMAAAMREAGSYRFEAEITGVNDQGFIDGRTHGEWAAPDRWRQRWDEADGDGGNELMAADGYLFAKDAPSEEWRRQVAQRDVQPEGPMGVVFSSPTATNVAEEGVVDGVPVYVVTAHEHLEIGQMPEAPGQSGVVSIDSAYAWHINQETYRLEQFRLEQSQPFFQNRLVDGTPTITEISQHIEHVFRFHDYGVPVTIEPPAEYTEAR